MRTLTANVTDFILVYKPELFIDKNNSTMYFSLTHPILLLVLLPITLYAANITTTTTTTAAAPIRTCTTATHCPSTYYCNTKQHVCQVKRSVNSTCDASTECASGKCHDKICRKVCQSDNDCSLTKEYCTIRKYCQAKHCSACIRNAQCANNHCRLFHCASDTCKTALAALQKH